MCYDDEDGDKIPAREVKYGDLVLIDGDYGLVVAAIPVDGEVALVIRADGHRYDEVRVPMPETVLRLDEFRLPDLNPQQRATSPGYHTGYRKQLQKALITVLHAAEAYLTGGLFRRRGTDADLNACRAVSQFIEQMPFD